MTRLLLPLFAALLLAACGHTTTVHAGRERPVSMDLATSERPVTPDLLHTTTTQRASRDYRRSSRGIATSVPYNRSGGGTASVSWYGEGAGTASGERFDPNALTFANRTMPFGTRVTFCHDGRCVTARCNDRGPFVSGRTFDLSRAAFAAIAPLGAGVATVNWSYA